MPLAVYKTEEILQEFQKRVAKDVKRKGKPHFAYSWQRAEQKIGFEPNLKSWKMLHDKYIENGFAKETTEGYVEINGKKWTCNVITFKPPDHKTCHFIDPLLMVLRFECRNVYGYIRLLFKCGNVQKHFVTLINFYSLQYMHFYQFC